MISQGREQHRLEVIGFLQSHLSYRKWEIELPINGTGSETYFGTDGKRAYFIKIDVHVERYQLMAEFGIAPEIVAAGYLESGKTILVQQRVKGRNPNRSDFHHYLDQFAGNIRRTHRSRELIESLPQRSSEYYKNVGFDMLGDVKRRWDQYRVQVPAVVDEVDKKIASLAEQLHQLQGFGLVASHNDICNGNWIVTEDGKIFLVDYESMSRDDPALDVGAILWWYYPPEMRERFMEIAGYEADDDFRNRMRIRMAIHNLHIILPREGSYDRFRAESFEEDLENFRAVIEGRENPQGYYD